MLTEATLPSPKDKPNQEPPVHLRAKNREESHLPTLIPQDTLKLLSPSLLLIQISVRHKPWIDLKVELARIFNEDGLQRGSAELTN
mmetsp:Transcript_3968/g.6094  ORF Transcript_3968/g.6094 Transcript_3968/m.6094 type:complete len:86 (-) Transcript_3968:1256-1513(-)